MVNSPIFLNELPKKEIHGHLFSLHENDISTIIALHEKDKVFISTHFYCHYLNSYSYYLPDLRGIRLIHTAIWEELKNAIDDFEYENSHGRNIFTPMISAFHDHIRIIQDSRPPLIFTSVEKTNLILKRDSDINDLRDILITNPSVEDLFYKYYDQWLKETKGISSSTILYSNPNYLKIIRLGEEAIPLLEKEIENKTGRLMYALKEIKNEIPN